MWKVPTLPKFCLLCFQMTLVSAYFGILLLAYCSFQLVDSCSDCNCCYSTYQQCFGMCSNPSECTACSENKENCEIRLNCASVKRSSEDWKPEVHPKPGFIQDQNNDLLLGYNQDQPLKYLLRDILGKREKSRQHWRLENSEFLYFR